MAQKISVLIILTFLLLLPLTFGQTQDFKTEYNETGTTNQRFLAGTGIFNENLQTDILSAAAFSDLHNLAMVADLDQDGSNEIILIDGDSLVIRNDDLSSLDSVVIKAGGIFDNMLIFDINKDGLPNIIIADQTPATAGNISIYQFNNSILSKIIEHDLNIPRTGIEFTDAVLQCGDQDGTEAVVCLGVWATTPTTSGQREITVGAFNATVTSSQSTLVIFNDPLGSLSVCLSQVPVIVYEDYDNDDRKEFIFSVATFKNSADDEIRIEFFDVKDNLTFFRDKSQILITGNDFNPVTTAQNCGDGIGRFFTSPMVFDIENPSDFKEIIIGVNQDSQDFRILTFKASGALKDVHPNFFTADGEIQSNVMLMNVFGDTGTEDYCVLGHDDENQELNLLCGSALTANILDTVEFKFNTDGKFNVSRVFRERNIISHSSQHSNAQINIAGEGNTDTTEIVTAYGTFRLNDNTFNGSTFVKDLDIIFESPVGDSACIPVDLQKSGSEDILCITDTQLFLIDDGLANAPGEITSVNFNPCVRDSVIKANTTIEITVIVEDQNPSILGQDSVTSVVTVYKNNPNSQNSTIANTVSGVIHPHIFTANATGTGFLIEIQGFDSENPTNIDFETQTFTVANTGIEFGDSECTIDFLTDAEAAEAAAEEEIEDDILLEDSRPDNGIARGIGGISDITGLSAAVIWLIFMVFIALAIFTGGTVFNRSGEDEGHKVAIVLLAEILLLIIGTLLGILPVGIIITIVVIGIVVVALFFNRIFTGSRTA